MAKNNKFYNSVAGWPIDRRIQSARDCVRLLTDRIQSVIELHAANEIIQYSSKLSGQISKSRAAHAFTVFQDAQFNMEIIKLIALWDSPAENSVSIPTVVILIDDSEVLRALVGETFDSHTSRDVHQLNPSNDPEIQKAIEEISWAQQVEFAKSQSEKAAEALEACVTTVKATMEKERVTSVRNLRDLVSHSVTMTRRESNGPVKPMKYGDEKKLLTISIRLVEDLYLWVNGTSFDISGGCVEIARKQAGELWLNCEFSIPQTRQ